MSREKKNLDVVTRFKKDDNELNNIKVLFCGPHADYVNRSGGHVHYCTYLPEKLSGYLKVILLVPTNYPYRILIKNNLKIVLMGNSELRNRTLQYMRFILKLRREYNIIHFNDVIPAYVYTFLKGILRKPAIITFHGYPSLEGVLFGKYSKNSLKFKLIRHIEKRVAERMDAIIAVGKTIREWIIDDLGVSPEKVFYIPNGIDSKVFRPIHKEENSLGDKIKGWPVLLFTKHYSPRYGAKDLIIAFKKIINVYPKAQLIMTNEDLWLPRIIEFSKKVNVSKNITFTGRVSLNTLVQLYNIADVFIHPSINEQETFGISVIEAMACETPVVATAVGGPKEIIEEGIRQKGKPVGVLVPPQNPDMLAKAILKILNNPDEARKMGKRAREYVLKNYTWDIVAKKTLEVYKYVFEKSK